MESPVGTAIIIMIMAPTTAITAPITGTTALAFMVTFTVGAFMASATTITTASSMAAIEGLQAEASFMEDLAGLEALPMVEGTEDLPEVAEPVVDLATVGEAMVDLATAAVADTVAAGMADKPIFRILAVRYRLVQWGARRKGALR